MSKHALFVGWNRITPGKDAQALELFQSWINFWGTQQKNKAIERFEPVMLSPHGGDLNGFFLVYGDQDKLHDIRWNNEEFQKLHLMTNSIVQGYGVLDSYVGDGIQQLMDNFAKYVVKG